MEIFSACLRPNTGVLVSTCDKILGVWSVLVTRYWGSGQYLLQDTGVWSVLVTRYWGSGQYLLQDTGVLVGTCYKILGVLIAK